MQNDEAGDVFSKDRENGNSQPPTAKSQQNPKTQNPTAPLQPPWDIRERSFEYAVRVLDVTGKLPYLPEANVAREQLAESCTSVGANIEEADGAVTRPDKMKSFVHSRKEARESKYWLRIIERKWIATPEVTALIRESQEIVNILSTIIDRLA